MLPLPIQRYIFHCLPDGVNIFLQEIEAFKFPKGCFLNISRSFSLSTLNSHRGHLFWLQLIFSQICRASCNMSRSLQMEPWNTMLEPWNNLVLILLILVFQSSTITNKINLDIYYNLRSMPAYNRVRYTYVNNETNTTQMFRFLPTVHYFMRILRCFPSLSDLC